MSATNSSARKFKMMSSRVSLKEKAIHVERMMKKVGCSASV